jgi:hypothetical protein
MEKQEFDSKMKDLEKRFEKEKGALIYEYALSSAIFKIGDIIQDHKCIIVVDKISASFSYREVKTVYHGIELTKKLVPKKSGDRNSVWGNENVKKLN